MQGPWSGLREEQQAVVRVALFLILINLAVPSRN